MAIQETSKQINIRELGLSFKVDLLIHEVPLVTRYLIRDDAISFLQTLELHLNIIEALYHGPEFHGRYVFGNCDFTSEILKRDVVLNWQIILRKGSISAVIQ
jgi:hypothetical protein